LLKTKAPGVGVAGGSGKTSGIEDLPPTKIAKARQRVAATLALLAQKWPACFSIYERNRKPLKVRIRDDILAELGDMISPAELALALGCYVANRVYRSRLVAGAVRIDLNGEPAGTVSEKDATHFARITRRRLNQLAAKSAAAKPIIITPAPLKRLSLSDLREAAKERRKAAS
jgi:ProP effector